MKRSITNIAVGAALLSATAVGYGISSTTTATLELSAGGTTVTVLDNSGLDANPSLGVVTYIGAVGLNWNINVTTGLTKPSIGAAAMPEMDLNSVNVTSLGAGSLSIKWSDADFGPLGAGTAFVSAIGGTTGGSVGLRTYGDSGNAIFGDDGSTAQTSLGPFGPVTYSQSASVLQPGPLASAYSLTLEATITHTAAGQASSFDATLGTVTVSDGGSTLLFLGGALGLLGWGSRRRKGQ